MRREKNDKTNILNYLCTLIKVKFAFMYKEVSPVKINGNTKR